MTTHPSPDGPLPKHTGTTDNLPDHIREKAAEGYTIYGGRDEDPGTIITPPGYTFPDKD
jgi:hypothetical protein